MGFTVNPAFLTAALAALIVLVGSIPFFFITGEQSLFDLWEVLLRSVIRMLRFSFFLCLPVIPVFSIFILFTAKVKKYLLRVRHSKMAIQPFKHWLARPFQGIGIIFLFSTKLIISLNIIVSVPETAIFHRSSRFQVEHFLTVSLITALISFILSILWTFDDMGIRYINRKDHEIKMIGKYLGTFMPVIFGFYGIFTLQANYLAMDAFMYILKLVIVLYPPFLIFSVFTPS